MLQSGPSLTDAGGGTLCHDIDTSNRPTADVSTHSQPPLQQPPSVGLLASRRSYNTLGDDFNKRMITDDIEKYRILLVEDSPLNRKMLSKLLKSKGHAIEEAADGQKGVDIVKQAADAGRNFDVILMDFVMPVMDGPTATRAIRAMHIRTPIFGLTGSLLLDHPSVL